MHLRLKEVKEMKEIKLRAYIKGVTEGDPEKDKEGRGEIMINIDYDSKNMEESFELLGIYEFIKREFGTKFATALAMKICYTENGLYVRHKIIRKTAVFQIKDVCNKIIEEEMGKIHKRLKISKKG